jgi:hypothetical protein
LDRLTVAHRHPQTERDEALASKLMRFGGEELEISTDTSTRTQAQAGRPRRSDEPSRSIAGKLWRVYQECKAQLVDGLADREAPARAAQAADPEVEAKDLYDSAVHALVTVEFKKAVQTFAR